MDLITSLIFTPPIEMPYAASLYFGGFNARAVLKELSLPSPTD